MHIVVHKQIADIDPAQWNSMLTSNNPFMRHEFLHGLEKCACVSPENGWQATHIAAYDDVSLAQLIGVMPCYIKGHSYGEYIFDWNWADAHHRHGLNYYPKLSNAIPFTPASGERWLTKADGNSQKIGSELLQAALKLVEEEGLSSFHSLFIRSEDCLLLEQQGLSIRHSTQFHWLNQDYRDFEHFLSGMSSKKRKNIKRERRRIQESEIDYEWLTGEQLNQESADTMYRFYARTISQYGAQSYLNKAFYHYLIESFADQTLFLFAKYKEQVIAGGLYFKSNDTLFGRYWGALDNFHSVHFETCYYQAIDWCIRNGYQKFEAGAQGEHKLARGLEPSDTYSAHWIQDSQFRDAIDGFLKQEENHIDRYKEAMQQHSPYKTEL
jgi:predicted N-acyltransferase